MKNTATVLINADGTEAVILRRNGFAVSLVDGTWHKGILYDFYEQNEFCLVLDQDEVLSIESTALKALAVYSPSPAGDKFAHLIEPLLQLHKSLERHKVGPLKKELEHFRLETVREWARLSLHRYALRSSWIALLWQTLNADALSAYPVANNTARDIAQALHLITATSESNHEQ